MNLTFYFLGMLWGRFISKGIDSIKTSLNENVVFIPGFLRSVPTYRCITLKPPCYSLNGTASSIQLIQLHFRNI